MNNTALSSSRRHNDGAIVLVGNDVLQYHRLFGKNAGAIHNCDGERIVARRETRDTSMPCSRVSCLVSRVSFRI